MALKRAALARTPTAANEPPPSADRYSARFETYTTPASFVSTVTWQKYQHRPHNRMSSLTRTHETPPSSLRYNPPRAASVSTTANTRLGILGATATPIFPTNALAVLSGNPPPRTAFHVSPPSFETCSPPPGPFEGGYEFHGGRRARQSDANTTCPDGSAARSAAPVSRSVKSVRVHVAPPSVDRYTPRVSLAAYACPSTATSSVFASCGSTTIRAICRESSSPICVQLAPPSRDRYMPSPCVMSFRMSA